MMESSKLIDSRIIEKDLINFFSTREMFSQGRLCLADTDLIEAGFDSMGMIELLLFIEEKYGLWIPEAYLTEKNFTSVSAIAMAIMSLLKT